jgi:hypothetical protein
VQAIREATLMDRDVIWRPWLGVLALIAIDAGLGFALAGNYRAESWAYKYGLLGASLTPVLFAAVYTITGLRGATKWWTNTLGTSLVFASVTLIPITWPLCWVLWFDNGELAQAWLAWVEVSGPVLSALAWLALCIVFLRIHRDGRNGAGRHGTG